MPIVKIEKVSVNPVETGNCEINGKQVTYYTRKILVDGQEAKAKVFKQGYLDNLKAGDHEYKREYKNEYQLITPKSGGGFGGRVKVQYSQTEFDKLFEHAFDYTKGLCEKYGVEHKHELISTYIIGAQNSGVKL
jgi:hypothetical protein